ncbi:hypothetical protein MPC1_3020003 [Methylocella tundrae]|nr:hypothetical protein MPC1_3020003 [Methylocella tundrae]
MGASAHRYAKVDRQLCKIAALRSLSLGEGIGTSELFR